MPDPVAPPAGAAPPPPAATPPPPPAEPPKPTTKELSSKLFSLLTATPPGVDDPPKPKEKPAEAPATPPATLPKLDDTPPDDGAIKRKKKDAAPPAPTPDTPPKVPKKGDLAPPPPVATPPPLAPAPEQTDADFEKTLLDEERLQLEDARGAERFLGDKYKGYGAKTVAYLKENAKKAAQVESGEIEESAYNAWNEANAPKISVLDRRQLARLEVKADLTKEFEPKIAEERHARWAESEAPKIKAKGTEIYNKLANTALPEEVTAAIAERTKGITDRAEYVKKVQEVQKDYALEFEITEQVMNVATNDIEEFQRITTVNPATQRALVVFDEKNQQHERIVKLVTDLCDEFKASGGAELKKDGKWFVTREEWHGMAPEQRAPFWTFTNEQLIERALARVPVAVKQIVATEHKKLADRGFKRTIAAPPAAPPPAIPPTPFGAPPSPRPAAVAPNPGAPPPSIGAQMANKLLSQPTPS